MGRFPAVSWQVHVFMAIQDPRGVCGGSWSIGFVQLSVLGETVREVSDVEFTFALLLDREFQFPFSVDGSLKLCLRKPTELFQKPTFVQMLRQYSRLWQAEKLFPAGDPYSATS